MASAVEVNGSTFRITWYFDGTRQRFSDRDRDVVVAAKAYVESLGGKVSQNHAVMLTHGFLDRAVAAEAIKRHRRDRIRTFRSVAHQMIEEREGNGRVCVKTALQRERLVDSAVFADWAGQDIREFTTDDIVAKKRALLTQPWERTDRNGRVTRRGVGYAPSTVASHIGFALGVLHYAAKKKLIESDPTDDFDHERNPATLADRFVEYDVWERVLEFASPESYPLWCLLAGSGLRPNEALALPARNVRYGAKPVVRVTQAFGSAGAAIKTLTMPKRLSMGDVQIEPELAELLRPLVDGKRGDDLVFTGPRGGWWDLQNVRHYHWNPMLHKAQRAGVIGPHEWFTPYALRHSYGSWLRADGVSLFEVGRRLRHKSIQTTADIYGHTTAADEENVMASLARRAPKR
jgi:integrase